MASYFVFKIGCYFLLQKNKKMNFKNYSQSIALKIAICFLTSTALSAQTGGGQVELNNHQCITEYQHQELIAFIKHKREELKLSKNIISKVSIQDTQKFIWPVKKVESRKEFQIYGVSNYVDHDTVFKINQVSSLKDYNCGKKTYDVENYNHSGTDIFLYPFTWKLLEEEAADAVAAKDGILYGKIDGNFDKNCSFCTNCTWNAVVIYHEDDDTYSIYGHLKSGSLTTLEDFESIKKGDYVGKVGSSGVSTGPHLHFEVLDADLNVIDPFLGNCNERITESLWENQRPYILPTINTIKTSTAPSIFGNCPDDVEESFEEKVFEPGDQFYVTIFLTDQIKSTLLNVKIINPSGKVIANVNRTLTDNFITSYWYWQFKFGTNDAEGEYTARASYQGQTLDHLFSLKTPTSINENNDENGISITNNVLLNEEKINVKIFDTSGKLIIDKLISGNLDLNYLSVGFYILQIEDAHKRAWFKKFIRG